MFSFLKQDAGTTHSVLTLRWVGANLYVILVNNTQGKSSYGQLNCQKLCKIDQATI